jgi:hypothetical protein
VSAELAARRTAAAAIAADFHTTMVAWLRGGERPDYAAWAQRLEQHLRYVLEALDVQDRAQAAAVTPDLAAGQLAEVRGVLAAFDWECDDRQYALEAIEAIVNRSAQ